MPEKRVRLLASTRGGFAYLVGAGEKALIDTGPPWRWRALTAELASLKVRPAEIKHILLTHYDADHIGNAARLQRMTGAAVWASATEIPYILGEKPRPGFKKHLAKLFRYEIPGAIQAYEDTALNGEVKVIGAPGHTPGHVGLLYGEALFAGDLVEIRGGELRPYPFPWNWDEALLAESIMRLNREAFRTVYAGHGGSAERVAWDKMVSSLMGFHAGGRRESTRVIE